MSGYIYCITNSKYKIDDIYKLGYTAAKMTIDEIRTKLLQRYETYFIDAECVNLFQVFNPVKAEKKLFSILDDYRYQKELFKADYDTIIKPALLKIEEEFSKYEEKDYKLILTPKMVRLSKKMKTLGKNNPNSSDVQNYIFSQNSSKESDKLNRTNYSCFFKVYSLYHNCCTMLYMLPNKEKKLNLDRLETNILNEFNCLDYKDKNLPEFINNFLKSI